MKKKILSIILIVIIVMIVSITTTYATNYLYNSNEVYYDNTNSNITSSDVQGAIDELYTEATNYSSINTRVNTLESYFNNNTAALNIVGSPVKINGKSTTDLQVIKCETTTVTTGQYGTFNYPVSNIIMIRPTTYSYGIFMQGSTGRVYNATSSTLALVTNTELSIYYCYLTSWQ